jgi:glycosyltransferase involved in cell wall biosynthesis
MQVAVVNLTSGGMSGGYRKYLSRIVPLLQENPHVSRLDVFVPPQTLESLDVRQEYLQAWPETDFLRRNIWLKRRLQNLSPDVIFVPTSVWLDYKLPTVIMVRNMEPLVVPFNGNSLSESIKNLARAFFAKRACQHADRIIAVSQYVQDFLTERWGIPEQKISLVYHGIDDPPSDSQCVRPELFKERKLDSFLFTAGSIRPARGLQDIIRALAILSRENLRLRLVVAGAPSSSSHSHFRAIKQLAERLGVAGQVIWAGRLSSFEMAWCYRHCEWFVVTSRAEACPNIVLEAMSHGCEIVSSCQPPMPEFLRDAALYYEPENADSLARSLQTALFSSDHERERRRKAAKVRAADFDWNRTVSETTKQLTLAINRT